MAYSKLLDIFVVKSNYPYIAMLRLTLKETKGAPNIFSKAYKIFYNIYLLCHYLNTNTTC